MTLAQREWLRQRFVGPPGYGAAAARLETPGTVVLLTGAPGSGRRAAAIVLLHGAGEGGDALREVSLDDWLKQNESAEPVGGERILFDLSAVSAPEFIDAQSRLGTSWEKLRRLDARMVMVIPRDHERHLRPDFHQLLVPIGRPDEAGVLARHLRPAGIELSRTELRHSVFRPLLGRSPMRELQQLSALLVQARSAGGVFATWAAEALAAVKDRTVEVAEQIAGLDDGRQKALLFTSAMLDEAPADAVIRLSERLLAKLGHPEDTQPRLDRPDPLQRLQDVGVKVEDERVRFAALAYGAAVRSHFWLYYPDLRPAFGGWVTDAVRETPWLESVDRQRLIGRYTEQTLRIGDVRTLTDLVESWAQDPRLLPEAMQVLGQGLLSEAWGTEFRRRIYDWSTTPRLPGNLARVLARTCVEVLAPRFPDQALVRLHQLARRELGADPPEVLDLLLGLVRRDRRLYLRLLDRLCTGLEKPAPERSDAGIFLALVECLPTWVPQRDVARGWRGVLTVARESRTWEPAVRAWLSAARRERDGGARLMGILVEAACGRVDVLSRFYLLAHGWAAGPDDEPAPLTRSEVAARFCRAIDRAQGIEPLDPAAAGPAEGSTA
ncbi:hypothetical protein [Kitasatospora sp. NPDC048538]|uniref:hypothetical protein n=1 Tax=unclassified Kitasatospora TaxID=2633591 RepID=UPI0033D6FBAC